MADPYVREVGSVTDHDEVRVPVGVDYDTVTVGRANMPGPIRLTRDQAEEFAQLFIAACWEAGENRRRMAEGSW